MCVSKTKFSIQSTYMSNIATLKFHMLTINNNYFTIIISSCENFVAKPLQSNLPVNRSTSLLPLISISILLKGSISKDIC